MDENSSVQQETFQVSQVQSQPEEAKPLVRNLLTKLLLVLFASSLIATVICLAAFYRKTSQDEDPLPCVSSECLTIAVRFSAATDPFTRPCDYFLFTCGTETSSISRGRQRGKTVFPNVTSDQERRRRARRGVEKRMSRELGVEEKREEVPDRLLDREMALLQKIKEILESTVRTVSLNSAERKAKRFYNTCMQHNSAEDTSSERFLTLVQQLGGWPVSGRWTQPDFNTTLALLMSQYDTFPFFNVYVGPDPRKGETNLTQQYIQIDQPDFYFPVDWNIDTHRSRFNTQAVRPFFSSCKTFMTLLDVPLANITQHCGLYVSLCSTLVTASLPLRYRLNQNFMYQSMTIQQLQEQAPAINWLNCLQTIFHPVPISQTDVVLLHNLPYIIYMSRTISDWKVKNEKMGSYPLHTYMILSLLQTLIPALDSRFTQTVKDFYKATNSAKEDLPRWRQCVLQAAKGFDVLLSHTLKEDYTSKEAEELIHDIYASFKTKVVSMRWKDEESGNFILNKVKSLTPRLSTNNEFLHQLNPDKHYAEVIMSETDYFSNHLQLLALQQDWRATLYSHPVLPDILSISPFLSGNDIIIPVGMLVSSLFHPTYPRAVNYGMLGSLIAKDLHRLLLLDILSQAESAHQESMCVWSHFLTGKVSLDRVGTSFLSPSQQQEVWVQYSALHVALQSYQKCLQRHSQDTSVSGISYVHLFLSSFIQASCDSDPFRTLMPFEPSFLVTVLCLNSDVCPKPLLCFDQSQRHSAERC